MDVSEQPAVAAKPEPAVAPKREPAIAAKPEPAVAPKPEPVPLDMNLITRAAIMRKKSPRIMLMMMCPHY
jgi:hypothetical protein